MSIVYDENSKTITGITTGSALLIEIKIKKENDVYKLVSQSVSYLPDYSKSDFTSSLIVIPNLITGGGDGLVVESAGGDGDDDQYENEKFEEGGGPLLIENGPVSDEVYPLPAPHNRTRKPKPRKNRTLSRTPHNKSAHNMYL